MCKQLMAKLQFKSLSWSRKHSLPSLSYNTRWHEAKWQRYPLASVRHSLCNRCVFNEIALHVCYTLKEELYKMGARVKEPSISAEQKKKHLEDRGACSAGLWKDSSKQTAEKKEKETKVIIVNKLKTGQELSEDSWRRWRYKTIGGPCPVGGRTLAQWVIKCDKSRLI